MEKRNIKKKINPKGPKSDEYDAVIIGAGIGGLTCGCYLAKAGLKVLIVEQHHKPGGYCTSFKRKGYNFDATTHYLGSFREGGILNNIYHELDLSHKVEIMRFDPSNVVLCPDYRIRIRCDINETIFELQEAFKNESKNIADFFRFISDSNLTSLFAKLRNKTFRELLDDYFYNNQIKSVLGVFLGNIGVPPSRASALSSVILFREFILDGGYYPKGGMQKFSDAFAERFVESGGEIIFNKKADKIVVENNTVKGAVIDGNIFMKSKVVVSNVDAMSTFCQLIGKEHLTGNFIRKINSLEISPSAFIVYLGLNKSYATILNDRCSWWCYLNRDMDAEKLFSDLDRKDRPYSDDFVFCVFPSSHDASIAPPGKDIIYLIVPAKMTNQEYWHDNKYSLAEEMIRKAEIVIPDVAASIAVKEIATPLTMQRYTLNRNGSSYGWTSTLSQIDSETMPTSSPISGLYLSGHWATQGTGQGGISTVAYCGKNVAEQILRKMTA